MPFPGFRWSARIANGRTTSSSPISIPRRDQRPATTYTSTVPAWLDLDGYRPPELRAPLEKDAEQLEKLYEEMEPICRVLRGVPRPP